MRHMAPTTGHFNLHIQRLDLCRGRIREILCCSGVLGVGEGGRVMTVVAELRGWGDLGTAGYITVLISFLYKVSFKMSVRM